MRKMIFAALVSTLAITSAYAQDNNAGCGWGSMLFDGKTDKASQVLAVTTNGFLGNQTFGITSGTAGCSQNGVVKVYAAVSSFMSANMDKVARDMAVGSGESLDTLAQLLGISAENRPAFYQTAKANFDQIFVSDSVTAADVVANLWQVMSKDAVLAQYAV